MGIVLVVGVLVAALFLIIPDYKWEFDRNNQSFSFSTKKSLDKDWNKHWSVPLGDISSFEERVYEEITSGYDNETSNISKTRFTLAILRNGDKRRIDRHEKSWKVDSSANPVTSENRAKMNAFLTNQEANLVIINNRIVLRSLLIVFFLIPLFLLFMGLI